MDKESPILIRVFKEESELEVWKQDRTGRFALLKSYPICRWSGELGPKIKEGDRQAPEGFYTITPGQMNPNSAYYLSFDLGYPNAYDRSHGRTGAQLMVHGDCSSRGCYSMTDEQISEIYALGRDAFFGGQKSFQVQAYPFRMTPQNLAKHRNSPHLAFWKMLKKGNDHFEVSESRAPRQRLREALRVRRAVAGRSVAAAVVQRAGQVPRLRGGRGDRHRRAEEAAARRRQVRRTGPPQRGGRAGQDRRRRRHASGVRRRGEAQSDRRRAVESRSSPRRRPEPFRRPCGRRAFRNLPTRRSWPASRRRRIRAARWRRSRWRLPSRARPPPRRRPSPRASSAACSRRSPETKAAEAKPAEKKSDGAIDRMARLVGLRKDEPKPEPQARRRQDQACRDARRSPLRRPRTARSVRSRPIRRCRTAEAQGQAPAPAAAAPRHPTRSRPRRLRSGRLPPPMAAASTAPRRSSRPEASTAAGRRSANRFRGFVSKRRAQARRFLLDCGIRNKPAGRAREQ